MTILLIAVAGVITFVACNKKNEMVNNIVKTNVVSISPDDDMDGYLLDLRKRMKSATKDGEAMPLADVEWNLTALENFGFCDGSKRSDKMIIDTFYTELRVKDGSVSLYDLNLAYEDNKVKIMNRFKSLENNDKNIYYIKCLIDSVLYNDCVRVTTITSMRNGGSMPRLDGFGPTDYWYDFDLRGKCGPYEGQCVGRDATTEMQQKVIQNMDHYSCQPGYRLYYTNIYNESIWYYGSCEDSPSAPDCLYTNWTYYNRCLTPDELNWYLNYILSLFEEWADANINRDIIDVEFVEDLYIGVHNYPPNYTTTHEFWTINYDTGVRNCTLHLMDD